MSFSPTRIMVEQQGEGQRLAVHGDLDVEGAEALRQALEDCLQTQPESIVVDLAATEFVDSLGLSGLLRCARDAHLAGVPLSVHAPPGHQARVLMDLSGTAGTLRLQPA